MDVLGRVAQLMQERGWSKYRLAQECGMSDSTISNMFRRNTIPTVPTIEAFCKAFGITLPQFFEIGTETTAVHLSDDQKKMFDRWSTLTPEQKELLYKLIDNMK